MWFQGSSGSAQQQQKGRTVPIGTALFIFTPEILKTPSLYHIIPLISRDN